MATTAEKQPPIDTASTTVESSKDIESTQGGSLDKHNNAAATTPMTFRKAMALLAMAFLWTGSQIPAYLYGGIPPYIYADIGGADRWTWFILGYLFALGAVCPWVGSLSDLWGRRWVAVVGALLLIIGNAVAGSAQSMNVFIAGMALNGAGAGINELTALAVTAELAPARRRGTYVALLLLTILPFCPAVLYAQLLAGFHSWRYVGLLCGLWALVGLVLTLLFYFPPPRVNSAGLTRRQVLARIDYVGGLLSVSSLVIFTAAVQWGGYQYAWGSAHVLVPLVLGIVLFVAFVVYEVRFAAWPMFPRAIFRETRLMALTLFITFVSGMNFFAILLFWPTQAYNVYGHDPKQVGYRGLALGFPILLGACIILVLLSVTKGRIRELMLVSCIFMTAGSGAMAALDETSWKLSILFLIISGLGIGGIVVPASIISTHLAPDALIATVTALTLAVRVLGGAIGYCIYWNVFAAHFKQQAITHIGVAVFRAGIFDPAKIKTIIELTAAGLLDEIRAVPGVRDDDAWRSIVGAGQTAYAQAYKWVYYVSIAFGGASVVACLFLRNIPQFMDNHVAAAYDAEPRAVDAEKKRESTEADTVVVPKQV